MPHDAEGIVDELEEQVADDPAADPANDEAPAEPDGPDHNAQVPGAEEPPD